MDRVKIQLNNREHDHIKEHISQIKEYADELPKAAEIKNTDHFLFMLSSLCILYFKMGQQYVWRYHR